MWRPTLEHVDCLTDTGPAWLDDGPIQPDWRWLAAPPVGAVPAAPTPTPAPPLSLEDAVAAINAHTDAAVEKIQQQIDQAIKNAEASAKKLLPLLGGAAAAPNLIAEIGSLFGHK